LGGGIYYYKKSAKTDDLVKFIFEDLIPNYDRYELKHIGAYFGEDIRKMADEPLMGLAMVVKGMKPVNKPEHLMRYYCGNMMETLKWDMEKQDLSFFWWGEYVHPYIAHYATYNTYTRKYVYYNSLVKAKYKDAPAIIQAGIIVADQSKLFIRLINDKQKREEFKSWFIAHFKKAYYVDKWHRLTQK
jgi:hypothetical protein